jgi:hypothetical protein
VVWLPLLLMILCYSALFFKASSRHHHHHHCIGLFAPDRTVMLMISC